MTAASTPLPLMRTLAQADRQSYVEQLIFARSPLNLWLTAVVLYAVLITTYAAAAAATSVPWIVRTSGAAALDPRPRLALTMALMICAVLAVQRYATIKQYDEGPNLAAILRPEVAAEMQVFPGLRLGRASSFRDWPWASCWRR